MVRASQEEVEHLIAENNRRTDDINKKFNPVTGEGSVLDRERIVVSDFPIPVQFVPKDMLNIPLVRLLVKRGSIREFLAKDMKVAYSAEDKHKVIEQFIRVRTKHDFPFWAAMFVYIKAKGGGEDILFRINRPQRHLLLTLEEMRLAGVPIRIILLKARQWGGSTLIQLYMAWLQLVHKVGLNSLIVAHLGTASDEIQDMFDRMIKAYPVSMLYSLGAAYNAEEPKFVGVGKSGNIHRVPQRNCKIKIGTAERPDSARGGDYNLVHLSEVGLWKKTEKKTPEDIVRSACSGVLYKPYTLIAYESTPNGVGNFFHKEYIAAKEGKSQFHHLFIAWFEIEQYTLPITATNLPFAPSDGEEPLTLFTKWLYDNRDCEDVRSDREEPGSYLWWLWKIGATLEAINWYIHERAKYTCHADMASEYPSDDIEAFTFSGRKVFSNEDVEQFRSSCRPPKWEGEIYGKADTGEDAIVGLRFRKEKNGRLSVWQDVEMEEEGKEITDRYLVVVDVCKGKTEKADFAVIAVFDRIGMMDGEKPTLVAQWYGHIDMDLLAWKATQIAEYYNHAMLVIESNTLETNNTKGDAEYILNLVRDVYDNLYARKQSAEDIKEGIPRKYGFHTNVLTKQVIINNLKMVLREQLYIERDEGCLDEYLTYIETDKHGYEAMEGYHDDKLMTRAIGMQICFHEMDLPRIIQHGKHAELFRKPISAATI